MSLLLSGPMLKLPAGGGGGGAPVYIGDYAATDSVSLDSGKTYAIAAGGYSADMTSISAGGDAGSVRQEHSFSGRRACIMDVTPTSAFTGALTFSSNPNRFTLIETGGRSFHSGLNGPNGSGGPDLSINTLADDMAIIAMFEFGDATHTWTSAGITFRYGAASGAIDAVLSDKLVCAGGTPEAFVKTDNGVGLSSCIGIYR